MVIPIVGGPSSGGQFFVGDTQVLANAMDAITSMPVDLGDGVKRIFAYWTFMGNEVETNKPKAVTLIMPIEILKALPGAARQLFMGIPLEYRSTDPQPLEDLDPDAFLRALRKNSGG